VSAAAARTEVLVAWRTLIAEGYHRPNDTIEALESALRHLGMPDDEIERQYELARGEGE